MASAEAVSSGAIHLAAGRTRRVRTIDLMPAPAATPKADAGKDGTEG